MPLALVALPAYGLVRWLADPIFHQIAAVLCCWMVIQAIVPTWWIHRSRTVALLATTGLSLVVAAAFLLPDACCAPTTEDVQTTPVVLQRTSQQRAAQLVSFPTALVKASSSQVETELVTTHGHENVGRALFNQYELAELVGQNASEMLLRWQPFMTPIGGLMLVLAHLFNLRLRCCR